jgi:NAD(P)-dependent dehydrogenase (short-subunit alcohol dehydrogenase family)
MGMLDGKVAIVTGAGRGIGREEALLLASEGAKVVVNDVGAAVTGEGADVHPAQQTVDDIKAAGGEAASTPTTSAPGPGPRASSKQAVDTWGQLDILVNNAGILRDKMSFNMDESDWDDVIRVHLKGHFATSHFAAVHWRNRSKAGEDVTGRIINTASEAGLFGNAGQANYGAAKAGIAAMTIILARELERYGVTVNAISPRARTRMTEDLFGDMAKAEEGKFDAFGPRERGPPRRLPGNPRRPT